MRMSITISFLCLFLGQIVIAQSVAQWQEYSFHAFGEGLGLIVRDIIKDNQGYTYVASSQGFLRYDGHQFYRFIHNPNDTNTAPAGPILKLLKGKNGTIWMTTQRGELSKFDPIHEIFSTYRPPHLGVSFFRRLEGLLEDEIGNIWVGAYHFRLFKFDPLKESFTSYTPDWIDPHTHSGRLSINSILQDQIDPDVLWMSVQDMNYYSFLQFSPDLVSFHRSTGKFKQHDDFGIIRFLDKDNRLWGTSYLNFISSVGLSNLNEIHVDTLYSNATKVVGNFILSDLVPFKDKMLLSAEHGLYFFKNETLSHLSGSEELGILSIVYLEDENKIWAGGSSGLFLVEKSSIRSMPFTILGQNEFIVHTSTIYDPIEDVVYLSTQSKTESFSQRLFKIPLSNYEEIGSFQYKYEIDKIAYFDDSTIIALCSDNKLHKFNTRSKQWTPAKIQLQTSLAGYRYDFNRFQDSLIVSTVSHQLAITNRNSGISIHIPRDSLTTSTGQGYTNNSLRGHLFLDDKRILVYNRDLATYNLETNLITRIHVPDNLNQGVTTFRAGAIGQSNTIWLSNLEQIIEAKLRNDSLIILNTFGIEDGLSSTEIFNIVIDSNQRIWTFGHGGINVIDSKSKEVRFFGLDSGLPFLKINNAYLLKDNRIIYTDWYNINIFHTDSLWHSKDIVNAKILIQEIRVNGQKLHRTSWLEKELHLTRINENVDISFQAIIFPTSDDIVYYYKFSNLSDSWVSLGANNFLTLPSLPPGVHELQLTTNPTASKQYIETIKISVPTPFVRSWLFVALITLAIVYLAWLYYNHRLKINDKRTKQEMFRQQEIIGLELKALRSQMNPHFMFNSLNSIKNYILRSDAKSAAKYLSNFSHLIRMILQQSRERHISLREEIDMLHLYLKLEQLRFSDSFDHRISVAPGVLPDSTYLPPMLLQPFIENALWHGLSTKQGQRQLIIKFDSTQDHLHCIVDDNGIGRQKSNENSRSKSTKHKSLGMGITQDRINLLNDLENTGIRFDVEDKINSTGISEGTRVNIFIPQHIYQE